MQETQKMQVQSLDKEDPLEEEMATHSGILSWRTPWTQEPHGLQSMGSQRAGHNGVSIHTYIGSFRFQEWSERFGKNWPISEASDQKSPPHWEHGLPTHPEGVNLDSHGPTPPLLHIGHDAYSPSVHLSLKHPPLKKNVFLTWIILKSLLNLLQHCLCGLCSSFLSWRHVGSWFPNQGSNSHSLHWKAKSFTTRPPGKSQHQSFLVVYKTYTKSHVLLPIVTLCSHIVTKSN